jgi:hypothetical protein
MDLERAQRKAAELVLEDEAWRDGIEDTLASPLLDWVLAQTDARLARAAEAGAEDEDLPYTVADEARAVLATVCDELRAFAQHDATEAATDGAAAAEPQAERQCEGAQEPAQ